MKRIYSVDKAFCNQFQSNESFMARAEELGYVWSTPQSFFKSYNNRENGTTPGQFTLRIIDLDPSQPNDPHYESAVYCVYEGYYKGEVISNEGKRIFEELEGWMFPDIYSVAESFNSLTDAYGNDIFPTWGCVFMLAE